MEFADLAARLGAPLVTTQFGGEAMPESFTVRLDGLPPVVVTATYRSDSLSEVTLRVDVARLASAPTITLRAEDEDDRQGKRLGLNREVQVRDHAFDDAVYIETDASEALVHELLAPTEVRARVLRFVEVGHTLRIEGGVRLRVGCGRLVELTPERVRMLAELAAHLPEVVEHADAWVPPRGPRIELPAFIGLGIVVYGLMIVIDPPEPLFMTHAFAAFALGFVPWFLFAAAVVFDRRGRPESYREIVAILGLSVLVSILPAYALGSWINHAWDPSAPRVEVVKARYVELQRTNAGRTREHVITAYGLAGQKEVTLEIDDDALAVPDPEGLQALRLTMRDGYFGWPYFTRVELVP